MGPLCIHHNWTSHLLEYWCIIRTGYTELFITGYLHWNVLSISYFHYESYNIEVQNNGQNEIKCMLGWKVFLHCKHNNLVMSVLPLGERFMVDLQKMVNYWDGGIYHVMFKVARAHEGFHIIQLCHWEVACASELIFLSLKKKCIWFFISNRI